jgi:hypothetical protein
MNSNDNNNGAACPVMHGGATSNYKSNRSVKNLATPSS